MSVIYAKIRFLAYSSVDWDFRPQGHHPSSLIGVDTSEHTDRSNGQANIRPKARRSAASSSKSLDRSEDLDISASPFVSALDKFKEIVPNCGISIRVKRKTTEKRQAQAVVFPVIFSTSNITYWWDELTKWAPSYLPNYLPYQTKDSHDSDVSEWVIQQAEKPLTPRERKAGYLYVYWNKSTFGVYKIGFTTRNVDERLREWERKCKHTAQKQYESPFAVRNIERLERLVHAELKEYRVKEYGCHGCLKNHDEWFNGVGLKVILKSIAFWTEWIMKEPYKKINGEWSLKEDAKNGLPQLCNVLSVAKAEENKEKSIRITPRRHNHRPSTAKRSSYYKIRGH